MTASPLLALVADFTSPRTMMAAEEQFLRAGADAIPALEAIFNGEAKNEHGVAYRALGLPLRCALEVASRLGAIAKPLEPYIRQEVISGVHWPAAAALRGMPPLEEASVIALADALAGELDPATEAAVTLVRLGHSEHPAVQRRIATSTAAQRIWQTVNRWEFRRDEVG
jgi:hypothetical protein